MGDICTDNRFELIEKYKKELVESTNIETSQDEMAVLGDLLFRFWQMGWLDRLEETGRKRGEWIESQLLPKGKGRLFICSECNKGWAKQNRSMDGINFCPNCGADMRGESDGTDEG